MKRCDLPRCETFAHDDPKVGIPVYTTLCLCVLNVFARERPFIAYLRPGMVSYSPEHIAALLGKTRIFAQLPPQELFDLARLGHQRRISPGGAIFLKGTPGLSMSLLCEGRVKITSSGPNGNELLLELVESGQHFGEIAVIDGGLRAVNAIAASPCQIVSFDRGVVVPILHQHPASALAFSKHLCSVLRTAIENVEEIALLDAPTRLWMRLRSLGRRYAAPQATNDAIQIDHGLSQQSLADSIGATRVMVSRQLGIWRDAGLIEHGRGFVRIPDPAALEAFVHGRGASTKEE